MPHETLQAAASVARRVDLMLALGSSLVVYPAAGIPEQAKRSGAKLVIINRDPTPMDGIADIVCHSSLGESLTEINNVYESLSSKS